MRIGYAMMFWMMLDCRADANKINGLALEGLFPARKGPGGFPADGGDTKVSRPSR